ncbi:MAG: hypothetical protein OXG82_17805 [Gammaproteobacteria bacterium]|nr:hypothetical protein [Gammaproteobacteria bacterium]
MAEPAIRDFPRLPRIDPAWRLPTEAELPYEDDELLAETDYQLEPLGYAFYGLRGHYAQRADVAVQAGMFVHYLRVDEHGEVLLDAHGKPIVDRLAPDVFVVFDVSNRKRNSYVTYDEEAVARQQAEAQLQRTEAARHEAESARAKAEASRLEAEAGRSNERRARMAAEAAAQQAAERIAELEARLQRHNR